MRKYLIRYVTHTEQNESFLIELPLWKLLWWLVTNAEKCKMIVLLDVAGIDAPFEEFGL